MSRRIYQDCGKVFTIEDNGLITVGDTQGYDDLTQLSGHSGVNNIPNLDLIDDRTVGVLTVPTFSDDGGGMVTIGATTVRLRNNPDSLGAIIDYPVAGATLGPLMKNSMEFIIIDYNNGSPEYQVVPYTHPATSSDNTIVFIVWRVDDGVIDEVHSIDTDAPGKGLSNKIYFADAWTNPYRLMYGDYTTARISETTSPTNRTITVAGGPVYALNQQITLGDFNSSTDRMTETVMVTGVWTYTDVAVYDNANYCNAGVKTSIPSNKYACRWFYRSIGDVKQVFYLLGRGYYNSLADAQKETPYTVIPPVLRYHCMLVGQAVIQEGQPDGVTVAYFWGAGGGGGGGTGASGTSGWSGWSGGGGTGASGTSGCSGWSGVSGFSSQSGYSGTSGFSAYSGVSGYSGAGTSGYSGYSGAGTGSDFDSLKKWLY